MIKEERRLKMTKICPTGKDLRTFPNFSEPLRLLPRHGKPTCYLEWVSQKTIKSIAFLPVYISLFVVLTAVTCIWIMPYVRGVL